MVCPVTMFRKQILDHGVISEEELRAVEEAIEQEIDEAVEYAKNAPFPAKEAALTNVFEGE